MEIRTFQRGDEEAQVAIYNDAARDLPKFKPASVQDVTRRVSARDFDPSMRFYAVEGGRPVAYAMFNPNGRVSYPWCRKGYEQFAEPLFQHMLNAMVQRGSRKAFAAYRGDWPAVIDFFRLHSFAVAREMVNFILDLSSMPTLPARPISSMVPLQRGDVPALLALAPHVFRCWTAAELEKHLFENPYFQPGAAYVLRSRTADVPLGAAILICNAAYADPRAVDASMPCFRLGAFGTEGMQTKRINGLFSFLCHDDAQCGAIASELLGHVALVLQDNDEVGHLAAQVPSDAPHLLRYYQMTWCRQGSFPVLERELKP